MNKQQDKASSNSFFTGNIWVCKNIVVAALTEKNLFHQK